MPELGRQAAVGLLHVHHLGVRSQDVELTEPGNRRHVSFDVGDVDL